VEPVFGQLKRCQKLTMMSRRGLAVCENEWLLTCAAHNLRQLHRHRTEGQLPRPLPGSQSSGPPKTAVSNPYLSSGIPQPAPRTALCNRLKHTA
jgi:hypothetical protein